MNSATDPPAVTMAEKVAFLSVADHYPEAPRSVTTIETHFSHVFLTDRHVYKLKKPERFPSLDLSTLAARHRNCLMETRVNRVLSPDVYLGVVPLLWSTNTGLSLKSAGVAVDYLVHMRRLDECDNLAYQLRHDGPAADEVDRAADTLAAFYARGKRRRPLKLEERHYRHQSLRDEIHDHLGRCPPADALCDALTIWLDSQAKTLTTRHRVDAHGDLRPQHVYLGKRPLLIDRLEFDARLRLVDPVEELCFLRLECDRLGGRWVGERFLDRYAALTGDKRLSGLENYYEAGRALLWALLAARHLATTTGDERHWRQRAYDYLNRGLGRMGVFSRRVLEAP
jgi:uncharacterized protein